jgi:hypothetical protein
VGGTDDAPTLDNGVDGGCDELLPTVPAADADALVPVVDEEVLREGIGARETVADPWEKLGVVEGLRDEEREMEGEALRLEP